MQPMCDSRASETARRIHASVSHHGPTAGSPVSRLRLATRGKRQKLGCFIRHQPWQNSSASRERQRDKEVMESSGLPSPNPCRQDRTIRQPVTGCNQIRPSRPFRGLLGCLSEFYDAPSRLSETRLRLYQWAGMGEMADILELGSQPVGYPVSSGWVPSYTSWR